MKCKRKSKGIAWIKPDRIYMINRMNLATEFTEDTE
jgi:hypothetical protein